MIKYVETLVGFSEIPDEITLCINITGCKIGCKNCHSPYLAEDIGEELTIDSLHELISNNKGITCVSFMGGDSNPKEIDHLASIVKEYYSLKTAWYSGVQALSKDIHLWNFSYIKLGPYVEKYGPLNSKTTNQRMYKVVYNNYEDGTAGYELNDITYKFYGEKN